MIPMLMLIIGTMHSPIYSTNIGRGLFRSLGHFWTIMTIETKLKDAL